MSCLKPMLWLILGGLLAYGGVRFLGSSACFLGTPFDLAKFEGQIKRLSKATKLANQLTEKPDEPPACLTHEIDYLSDLKRILENESLDCQEAHQNILERHSTFQQTQKEFPNAITIKDIQAMPHEEQKHTGMGIIVTLGPLWEELLAPVKSFVSRCPKESSVLTQALGNIEQG